MTANTIVPFASSLDAIPLFENLAPHELTVIASFLIKVEFPSGTLLFTRDQQQSEFLYIMLEGAVKVQIEQADGTVAIIAILGRNQVVGEMSQTDDLACSATVETIERSSCLRLSATDYQELARAVPGLSQNMLRISNARLRAANQQILALVTLDAAQRVAAQIYALAKAYGSQSDKGLLIPFRLTQGTLAAMTGLSRVRVNRIVQEFVELGAVMLTRRYQIAVLDEAALLACATPGGTNSVAADAESLDLQILAG